MKTRLVLARAGALLALTAISYRYMDLLGDTFWAIATGRHLLRHGPFPAIDPFSFTAGATPWVVHMPLCQVLFALIADGAAKLNHVTASAAGAVPPCPPAALLALVAFGVALHVASLALLLFPYAREPSMILVGAVVLTGIVYSERLDLCVRGQLFGDLGFALLLLALFRINDGHRVAWYWPVLLGSLWIQLHASCALAVVIPLAWALLASSGEPRSATARRLATFAGLAFAGSFLNPYLHALPFDLARLLASPSTQEIDLFKPPSLGEPTTLPIVLAIFIVAFLAVRRPETRSEGLLLLLLACAGAGSRRYLPLAASLGVVLLMRSHARWPVWIGHPSAALGLAALGAMFGLKEAKDPYRDVPVEEAALVESLGLPDNVLNAYHWGGYLDYAWDERRRVFVDGRNQLFESGAFDAAGRIASGDHVKETLSAYRINTVVWPRGTPLDAELRGSDLWTLVHAGRIAVLYTRRTPVKTRPRVDERDSSGDAVP